MIYEVKIKDKNGKLKSVMSAAQTSNLNIVEISLSVLCVFRKTVKSNFKNTL